jgi:8-oxo-dGTP pyrophosphatase MutT (NUDIX family)
VIEIEEVAHLVAGFTHNGDGVAEKSKELILALLEFGVAPLERNHFNPGHLTCTGVVLHPKQDRVLLVHHRRLERWLLPGGHVDEKDECISETARREVIEETGVELRHEATPLLVGLDVHGIPAKGREPFHLHHDLVFRFFAKSEKLKASEEARAVEWCQARDFDRFDLPLSIRRSYERAQKL